MWALAWKNTSTIKDIGPEVVGEYSLFLFEGEG